jgi:hypothetical protein
MLEIHSNLVSIRISVFSEIKPTQRHYIMIAQIQTQINEFVSPSSIPPKFILRHDLTLEIRSIIASQAYIAQVQNVWGVITELSRQYKVSRTFIYNLLDTFKAECGNWFFPKDTPELPSQEEVQARIIAYRFEGRCSISAISILMKRDGMPFSSQGGVSEFLTQTGKLLPNTLENESEAVQLVVFANDEIFSKSQPILITADPVSSAILRIELADNRTSAQWGEHYDDILNNGFKPKLLTNDAGVGICAANTEKFEGTPWQLDTFHSVAQSNGDWDRKLKKAIESATNHATDRENKLASAKNDTVIDKRLNFCIEADEAIEKARELHENFSYLYHEIIHQLNTFDSSGNLREQESAKSTIEAALSLMEELNHKGINKDIISVRKALPHFLTYFVDARIAVNNCQKQSSNKDALACLYLAWQWDKAVIKSKQTDRKHTAIEQRDFYLELAMLFADDQESGTQLKENVYAELDKIIQASSMVECINSLLRPILTNSRNQVTQEFLNTFMFYHNHRRYDAGKRKGKTPMEILTGNEQKEDWIALLQKKLKKTTPPNSYAPISQLPLLGRLKPR